MSKQSDKRYILYILYPATPAELVLNAEVRVVDSDFVRRVAEDYTGGDVFEYIDDDGIETKKYGRIVFREFVG
jgi:hypothetical protein